MDLNPGPLSFEASALLAELTRPDKYETVANFISAMYVNIPNEYAVY